MSVVPTPDATRAAASGASVSGRPASIEATARPETALWAVVEGILGDEGRVSQVDRRRTLAVHGRRIFHWMADNTGNVANLTDADLDELSEHVQHWLAATGPDMLAKVVFAACQCHPIKNMTLRVSRSTTP